MQQITVSLGQRSYPIEIGPGLLREARRRLEALPVKRWAVIADENTAALYAGALDLPVYTFPAGEGSKRLAVYEDLCRRLLADGFTVPTGKSSLEQQAAEAFFAAVGRPMPPLTVHLEKTTPAYAGLGGGSADVAERQITAGGQKLDVLFLDGLTSGGDIAEQVLRPLMQTVQPGSMQAVLAQAEQARVYCAVAERVTAPEDAADKLLHGYCAVVFPGTGAALCFETKTDTRRVGSVRCV